MCSLRALGVRRKVICTERYSVSDGAYRLKQVALKCLHSDLGKRVHLHIFRELKRNIDRLAIG
jgi:hypothetical protein